MEDKITYDQIEEANKAIQAMKLGNKDYATVNERVKAFRKVYPTGSIVTNIDELRDDYVRMSVYVKDGDNVISTGVASETKKGMVNSTSMLENCETSAVGRALGFAGFGIDNSIASGEDVERNKEDSKRWEVYTNLFIKEKEAIEVVRNSINELMRKMGIRKVELEAKVEEHLWTGLLDLGLSQLLRLEDKIRTVNTDKNDWNDLYAQNDRAKDITPKGQEVSYESSSMKFGKIALQMAGSNETLKNEIIDEYLQRGIDLTKLVSNNDI